MITKKLFPFLLIGLVLSATIAGAQVKHSTSGTITSITSKRIFLQDHSYPLLATTKVRLLDNKSMKRTDLRPGDIVSLELLKLDGKSFVDTITLINTEIFQRPNEWIKPKPDSR